MTVFSFGWTPTDGYERTSLSITTWTLRDSSFMTPKGVTAPLCRPSRRSRSSSEERLNGRIPGAVRSSLRSTVLSFGTTSRQ